MEREWLDSLNKLAKNEEIEEHEYHESLNKDVREEKIINPNHLLELCKSKHKINIEEETTTTLTDPVIDTKDEDVFNQPPSKRAKNNNPEQHRIPKPQKYPPETSGEICNKSTKELSPNHDEFDTSDTDDDNDDDSDYVYSSESSSCEETRVTKLARKLDSDEESIKERKSPIHKEFIKEMDVASDTSDAEYVNGNNDDDSNYVSSPCEETKVTKSARRLNSDEEISSVSPTKRIKLNEDTTPDGLNESVNFDYGLGNYEEGIIVDSEKKRLDTHHKCEQYTYTPKKY